MSHSLLESVFIPGPKSKTKELYNILLVEKLLRILYASCQYGKAMKSALRGHDADQFPTSDDFLQIQKKGKIRLGVKSLKFVFFLS